MKAITPDVLKAIANAGPELQVKLLQGLGVKSMLITDGKTPVNLFDTALQLVGAHPTGKSADATA